MRKLSKNFKRIKYCDHTRKNNVDLKNDSDFIDLKYKRYTKIFTERLNYTHKKNYSTFFWSKALSIGFLRQIVTLYDHFKTFELYFDKSKHFVNVLDYDNFEIPESFDESRNIISDDLLGTEQVFSIYMNLFFVDNIQNKILLNKTDQSHTHNVYDYLFQKLLKIKRYFTTHKKGSIKIGILGSYFNKKSKRSLIKLNKGEIDEIFIYPIKNKNNFNLEMRESVFFNNEDFDRFDTFFFKAQNIFFPKFFLENFKNYEQKILKKLNFYKNLKIIISENWIVDSINSLALAIAKEKFGIIHINNEHNCFSHIYEGRFQEYLIRLVDYFFNIGWKSNNEKIIRSSSLYDFSAKVKKKKYKILFISSPIVYKMKYFSSFEVFTQENALSTIEFNNKFFNSLNNDILKCIYYKKYPNKFFAEKEKYYDKSFENVKHFNFINKLSPRFSVLNLISKSKLVIVDYISTAYLESLISDIPTIVFFDKSSIFLKEEHKSFFESLIISGIFQTNPINASKLIEKIYNDPLKWWNSPNVRKSRDLFLKII